jgi:hypothetical protein
MLRPLHSLQNGKESMNWPHCHRPQGWVSESRRTLFCACLFRRPKLGTAHMLVRTARFDHLHILPNLPNILFPSYYWTLLKFDLSSRFSKHPCIRQNYVIGALQLSILQAIGRMTPFWSFTPNHKRIKEWGFPSRTSINQIGTLYVRGRKPPHPRVKVADNCARWARLRLIERGIDKE